MKWWRSWTQEQRETLHGFVCMWHNLPSRSAVKRWQSKCQIFHSPDNTRRRHRTERSARKKYLFFCKLSTHTKGICACSRTLRNYRVFVLTHTCIQIYYNPVIHQIDCNHLQQTSSHIIRKQQQLEAFTPGKGVNLKLSRQNNDKHTANAQTPSQYSHRTKSCYMVIYLVQCVIFLWHFPLI